MPYYVHDKIISPNLWNEQWEVGTYDSNGLKVPNSSQIRSKNYTKVISNQQYYFYSGITSNVWMCFYDKDTNFIRGTTISNQTFTTPSNCQFIAFAMWSTYGTTYKHDICINVSNPAINGHYYPYNMGAKKYVIKDNNNSMNIGG